jgi:uncharacterized protein YdaU (DUF1376 family)
VNYYSHHIGDYLTDTAHLSILEDGAYRRLMDRYYSTETPINSDETALFRVLRARSPEEQEAVRVVLEEFFDLTEAGWTHKRCDAEIEAFRAKSGKAAEAANKRWSKPSDASAMPTHSERNADAMPTKNQEPRTNNQEPTKSRTGATQRASRLPADWTPTAEDISFCKAERQDLDPHETGKRFADYWHAVGDAKGRKLDWPATWRNWVRNEKQQARASPAGYESAKDRSRREAAEQLTGRSNHEQRSPDFIDINQPGSHFVG